ncbi:D-lactate dehydrogenase cytochrome oxidoreductase [Leucogyrophana mollusca]|uniref:D-lactate dehydrogenase cytochrome oxidoreductase n=1 Tax=Leucogyrophana mollusca TaxID=85980 RepID=A0ACB8BS72_9AGAM|nr:D-lactate dehydrogenase cytochrome oxidoreductase [Leucogyrophana mollusca]
MFRPATGLRIRLPSECFKRRGAQHFIGHHSSSSFPRARSHAVYSIFSARASRNDTERIGRFVLSSLLVFGAGFYAFQRGSGYALTPLRLGAAVGHPQQEEHLEHNYTVHLRADGPPSVGSKGSVESTPSLEAKYGSSEDVRNAIEELRQALPGEGKVQTNPDTLKMHGSSENSYHPSSPHSVVVQANSTEDVVKIVNISRKYRVPITAYSGATSLEGHFSGYPSGSICLDMSAMDQILEINEADGDLRCQSGVRWEDINSTLREKGIPLFFPLDPGPGATIGGMIGTGCSGTNAVRYGTAKAEWFLNVTVVLPSGKVIKTRQRSRKSSAGFDTTKLFIGAEGTLGIITEVAMAQFPDVEKAVSAVQEILNTPYGPHIQCVELLDDHMMSAINVAGLVETPYPVQDTLFFKLQGAPEAIDLTSNVVQAIVQKHGSNRFEFAATEQEAEDLWENRKYALISTMSANPGFRCWTTDVCVPVSRLPQLVYETKEDLAKAGLRSTIVGHVGDGNFHALILFRDEKELQSVSEAVHRLIHRAISLDGTCTGEHGVGIGKTEYLVDELGEDTVELMRTVKRAIDPLNLFNPGKLYPNGPGGKKH